MVIRYILRVDRYQGVFFDEVSENLVGKGMIEGIRPEKGGDYRPLSKNGLCEGQ